MAQDPKNYRDPKVTTDPRSSNDAMRWVWIAAALIVVLLFLAWIFGWFGRDATVMDTTTPPVASEPAAGTGAAPSTAPLAPAPAPTDSTVPTPEPTDSTTPAPAPAD